MTPPGYDFRPVGLSAESMRVAESLYAHQPYLPPSHVNDPHQYLNPPVAYGMSDPVEVSNRMLMNSHPSPMPSQSFVGQQNRQVVLANFFDRCPSQGVPAG